MIKWMSKEVEKAWDERDDIGLVGLVCEIHDHALKGHVVIQLEVCDYIYQLDLGDCTGLSDAEINARFVNLFPQFVDAYEADPDCFGPLVEDLRELADAFKKTIGG